MNIGKRIKERRKELSLSVDDVAKALGKNRATVYRYESNDIENLPITVLEPLSSILNTTPEYLMGWTEDVSCLSNIKVSIDELNLLNNYNMLNKSGKTKLIDYSNDLIENNRYLEDQYKIEYSNFKTLAAHDDDLTEAEKIESDKRILELLKKRNK